MYVCTMKKDQIERLENWNQTENRGQRKMNYM